MNQNLTKKENINNTYNNLNSIAEQVKQITPFNEILDLIGVKYEPDGIDQWRTNSGSFPQINDTGDGIGKKIVIYEHSYKTKDHNGILKNYATGENLDKIAVYALGKGITAGEAILELAEKKGIPLPTNEPRTRNILLNDICNYNNTLFNPEFKEAELIKQDIYNRGFNDNDIKKFKIGYRIKDRRIIIPYFNGYTPVNLSGRILSENTFNKLYPNDNYSEFYSNNSPCKWQNSGKYKKANAKYYRDNGVEIDNTIPFNYNSVVNNRNKYKEVYLTEGLFDSITLSKLGLSNLGLGGTEFSNQGWNNIVIPELKKADSIILLGDNDEAGKQATEDIITDYLIPNEIFNFSVEIVLRRELDSGNKIKNLYKIHFLNDKEVKTEYPNNLKDIADFYKITNSIEAIQETRISGLAYLAYSYSIKNKGFYYFYDNVINPIKRKLSEVQINYFISSLKKLELYSEEEIDYLKNKLFEKPKEAEIVEAIKADYKNRLLYNDSTGFYLFNGKVWEAVSDRFIHNLISNELGDRFKAGGKLKPITDLLKADNDILTAETEFNKKDIVVFNNGTLYLNNGNHYFKEAEFNPEDRMTLISNYDYQENPEFPVKWNSFLKSSLEFRKGSSDLRFKEENEELIKSGEIVEANEILRDKINLLQEFSGYTLFGRYDPNLQNCLILLGDGSNGKTTFFNTIEKTLPKEAITRIAVEDMTNPVYTVKLKDSILNISDEERSNLYGSERLIKRLTAGEPLTAKELYKNPIEFTPRTKLIICGNNNFTIEDKSQGTTRRLLFIEFPYYFIDPDSELIRIKDSIYKPKDPNLEEELEKELPAIFKWILDGYERLKRNRKFTIPEEHLTKLNEFKVNNNSVLDFIYNSEWINYIPNFTEGKSDYFCINSDLFYQYNEYARINGFTPIKIFEKFFEEFKRQLKAIGVVFVKDKYYYSRKNKLHLNIAEHNKTGKILYLKSIPDELLYSVKGFNKS